MRWSVLSRGTGEADELQPQPQPPPSQSQGARRWPFVAVLLAVVLLGSSPWLYSQLMPKEYEFQGAGNILHSTPMQMMYNPFGANYTYERAVDILNCTNRGWKNSLPRRKSSKKECPSYFHWIQKDLAPWNVTGINRSNLEMARPHAAFRLIILDSKLYIDRFTLCFQTRAVFTLWGLLLFLEKFKGQVPDVEFMFNCEDRPRIGRASTSPEGPPILFSYDSNTDNFDIPFPDWSFWGWSDLMIASWDEERAKIVKGSKRMDWKHKTPKAYWTGNPYVGAAHRVELLKCNNAMKTAIQSRDWGQQLPIGKVNSKLEDQCTHRYMIYTEGIGWSVSLKYILACGSPTVVIAPYFYDFFSRGLQEWVSYIPARPPVLRAPELCQAIDKGVEYGDVDETRAIKIGKAALDFMQHDVNMENVYNYMFHLLQAYAKLQRFEPSIPGEPHLLTLDHIQCLTEDPHRHFLQQAMKVLPPNTVPCHMPETPVVETKGFEWEVKTP